MKPAQRLRELLADSKMIIAPGAYDALSAKLVEQAGFDVVLIAGGTYSNFHYGVPDNGFISQGELIEAGGASRPPLTFRSFLISTMPEVHRFKRSAASSLQSKQVLQPCSSKT